MWTGSELDRRWDWFEIFRIGDGCIGSDGRICPEVAENGFRGGAGTGVGMLVLDALVAEVDAEVNGGLDDRGGANADAGVNPEVEVDGASETGAGEDRVAAD